MFSMRNAPSSRARALHRVPITRTVAPATALAAGSVTWPAIVPPRPCAVADKGTSRVRERRPTCRREVIHTSEPERRPFGEREGSCARPAVVQRRLGNGSVTRNGAKRNGNTSVSDLPHLVAGRASDKGLGRPKTCHLRGVWPSHGPLPPSPSCAPRPSGARYPRPRRGRSEERRVGKEGRGWGAAVRGT